jgi:hypothetical protein
MQREKERLEKIKIKYDIQDLDAGLPIDVYKIVPKTNLPPVDGQTCEYLREIYRRGRGRPRK